MTQEEVYKLIENHYQKNFPTLVNRFSNIIGGKADAEDIVQDAYTWCLVNWKRFVKLHEKKQLPFSKWHYGALLNATSAKKRDQYTMGMTDVEWI